MWFGFDFRWRSLFPALDLADLGWGCMQEMMRCCWFLRFLQLLFLWKCSRKALLRALIWAACTIAASTGAAAWTAIRRASRWAARRTTKTTTRASCDAFGDPWWLIFLRWSIRQRWLVRRPLLICMIITLISHAYLKYSSISSSVSTYILLIKVLSFIKRAAHIAENCCCFGVIVLVTGCLLLVQNLARGLFGHIIFHLCFHVVLI